MVPTHACKHRKRDCIGGGYEPCHAKSIGQCLSNIWALQISPGAVKAGHGLKPCHAKSSGQCLSNIGLSQLVFGMSSPVVNVCVTSGLSNSIFEGW